MEKTSVFKMTDSFKTLLKADIISTTLVLFTERISAVGKNACYSISWR